MSIPTLRKKITIILFILSICTSFAFSQDPSSNNFLDREYATSSAVTGQEFSLNKKDNSLRDEIKQQAREYRNQGLEFQEEGDLEAAMSYYQKSIELDPHYAVAYNDLGVIFEANGLPRQAEEYYLKSLMIDPNYLSAYSNLGLLYEKKRDYKKASFYWRKRLKLGDASDPWTQRARKHLDDIGMLIGGIGEELRQEEAIDLMQELLRDKQTARQSGRLSAYNSRISLNATKSRYAKGDYAGALKNALTAQYFDPENKDIERFIEEIRMRLVK
jgi:tetratricopeptide (TPR) repeat protein